MTAPTTSLADNLASVARLGSDVRPGRMAEALGWGGPEFHLEPLGNQIDGLSAVRGFVGSEPAALFVAVGEDGQAASAFEGAVGRSAFAGYHASTEWGALADPHGVTVFNSRWLRNGDWFRLPRVPWPRAAEPGREQGRTLELLSPASLLDGVLDREAVKQYAPETFLRPVDDELVARLDAWRTAALEVAPSAADGIDEALQRLFAQLFVLRAVEDRRMLPALPPLETVLRGGAGLDRAALHDLFTVATRAIEPELFAERPAAFIQDDVVAGVIRDLYVPSGLPTNAGRYNFAWLDVDVLGRAYEKYLSTVLEYGAPLPQQDLFRPLARTVEARSVRKQGGVYYTPEFLVRSLATEAIDAVTDDLGHLGDLRWPSATRTPDTLVEHLTQQEFDGPPPGGGGEDGRLPVVADFACGSGHFLVAAADLLLRKLRAQDPTQNWAHELVRGRHLIGIDVDPRAVTLTKLNLWIRFASDPEALPLPALHESIMCADSLGPDVWDRVPTAYDVVLGNPPFLATGNVQPREELATRFRTAQGRYDYAYLFVELAATRLKPHGVLGLVVPNRLYQNDDAGTVRAVLTEKADLLTVVDFGSLEVFKGVSAYIGTITARARAATDPEAERTRVVRVTSVDAKFLGALLSRAAREGEELQNDVLHAFDVPHPRGAAPWLLLPPEQRARRARLAERSVRLDAVAITKQGIRTGANDVFIVQVESRGDDYARILNGLGEGATVESALLHPVVFGSDIQRYDVLRGDRHLLYPYRQSAAIEEAEFRERYPRTWAYLERYRTLLAGRSSLAKSGLRWYELIRKREASWLGQPKLLIRDLAMRPSFALDATGEIYLAGGTAVVPASPDLLLPLLGYLNSGAVADLLKQVTPSFRGDFQKYEPRHLNEVNVPRRFVEPGPDRDELARLAAAVLDARARRAGVEEGRAEVALDAYVTAALDRPITDDELGDDEDDDALSLPFGDAR